MSDDNCAYCRWPIDHSMGAGLNVAISDEATSYRWTHSICAAYIRSQP